MDSKQNLIKKIGDINPSILKKGGVLLVGATVLVGCIYLLKDNGKQLPTETTQDTMSDDTNYESFKSEKDECAETWVVNIDDLKVMNMPSLTFFEAQQIGTLNKGQEVSFADYENFVRYEDCIWVPVNYINSTTKESEWGWTIAYDYTTELPTYNIITKESYDVLSQIDSSIEASSAVVVDIDTGKVIYEKNGDRKMEPASFTKILTNYLAHDINTCPWRFKFTSDEITVDGHADEGYGLGSSQTDVNETIKEGVWINPKDAMYISLLLSENSSTLLLEKIYEFLETDYTYREYTAGVLKDISYPRALVEDINLFMKEIGCTSSCINNSYGYDEINHYITANDMAKVISYIAQKSPEFIEMMGTKETDITYWPDGIEGSGVKKTATIKHQSKLLDVESEYYDPNVVACQTGASEASMLSIYEKDGKKYAIITFNGTYTDSKYDDATKLFGYIDIFSKSFEEESISSRAYNDEDLIGEVSIVR